MGEPPISAGGTPALPHLSFYIFYGMVVNFVNSEKESSQ